MEVTSEDLIAHDPFFPLGKKITSEHRKRCEFKLSTAVVLCRKTKKTFFNGHLLKE